MPKFFLLDKRFTDLVIQPARKRNESSAFCQMAAAAGSGGPATVYIGDRGMRPITILLMSSRTDSIFSSVPLDYLSADRPEYAISLRVVRIGLSPGSFENLITNLPDHEFDMDDFKELYHLRWNEESAYRNIKYPLCLKALHSKKYEYVVKEVWARAILFNFSSEIALNVEIEKRRGNMSTR